MSTAYGDVMLSICSPQFWMRHPSIKTVGFNSPAFWKLNPPPSLPEMSVLIIHCRKPGPVFGVHHEYELPNLRIKAYPKYVSQSAIDNMIAVCLSFYVYALKC